MLRGDESVLAGIAHQNCIYNELWLLIECLMSGAVVGFVYVDGRSLPVDFAGDPKSVTGNI